MNADCAEGENVNHTLDKYLDTCCFKEIVFQSLLYSCAASNAGAERFLIHCFLVNMREFSPARQTFTATVTKPSPDHDLKVAREES